MADGIKVANQVTLEEKQEKIENMIEILLSLLALDTEVHHEPRNVGSP